jgi:hypothetical protein
MTSQTSDELIFDISPVTDNTDNGPVDHTVNLTALRDGHPGRSTIIRAYPGSKVFGLRFALTIKELLKERKLGPSDAMQFKSAANYFMDFFARKNFRDDIIPSRDVLKKFADDLESRFGKKIPVNIPIVYRLVSKVFETMCPGLVAPRSRFALVDASEDNDAKGHLRPVSPRRKRAGAQSVAAALAAAKDFTRVHDRISIGRAEAESEGDDMLREISRNAFAKPQNSCTRQGALRLFKTALGYQPISSTEFYDRFGYRTDLYLNFPAPGRAATVGHTPMQSGLVGMFRWVLPTATDLMGPVVLCLEHTGWNKSTLLSMKSSMVSEAIAGARDGKSKIWSWKARAARYDETSVLAGPDSLLAKLAAVQTWNAPLRQEIVDELSLVDDLLEEPILAHGRQELEKRRKVLVNMRDRLWLCLGSSPVGVTRLKKNDLCAKTFAAMFTDNGADLNEIGKYNCQEARLNYLARLENGRNLQGLLKTVTRHASMRTTQGYADQLPSAAKSDRAVAQFSKQQMMIGSTDGGRA